MQKTEIAQGAGWEEDTEVVPSTVPIQHTSTQNTSIQDSPVPNAPVPGTPIEHPTLLDAEDRVAPNEINTERPIWRHPIPRTVLVAIGAITIGFGVVRLTEGNGLIHSQEKQVVATSTPAPKPHTTGSDKGELQAKLATIKLQQKMEALQKAKQAALDAAKSSNAKKPPSVPVATSTTIPVATAYNPPPSYSRPPIAQPVPIAQPPIVRPKPVQLGYPPPQVVEQLDPMEQWLAAANVGSYGSTSNDGIPPSVAPSDEELSTYSQNTAISSTELPASGGNGTPPTQSEFQPQTSQSQLLPSQVSQSKNNYQTASYPFDRSTPRETPDTTREGMQSSGKGGNLYTSQTSFPTPPTTQEGSPLPLSSNSISSYNTDNCLNPQTNQNGCPVPSRKVRTFIRAGTRAAGKLDTPIRWSGDRAQSSGLTDFIIELTKPLKTVEGSEAIPAGSYLTVQVISADSAGILQLSPISVQLSDGQEKPLPEGAILIFDKKGNTLQAKFHAPGTRKNFLSQLGDAAGIAGLATDNSSLYILNALGNRQNSQSRPTYFSLDKGTPVEIYVKQSFSP